VNNAINQPQTILVLGGNSDIARAIVAKLESPALKQVILGCRRPDEVDLSGLGEHVSVVAVAFDATAFEKHTNFVDEVAREYGDLDIVIQAFGQLGDEPHDDPAAAARLAATNYGGAVSSGLAVAQCLKKHIGCAVQRRRGEDSSFELHLRVDQSRPRRVCDWVGALIARDRCKGNDRSTRFHKVIDDRRHGRGAVHCRPRRRCRRSCEGPAAR